MRIFDPGHSGTIFVQGAAKKNGPAGKNRGQANGPKNALKTLSPTAPSVAKALAPKRRPHTPPQKAPAMPPFDCLDHPPTYEGGCLCGAIRFEVRGPVHSPHTCACRQCQRHCGARQQDWVELQNTQVRWVGAAGAPALWRSSAQTCRAFCPQCGSTVGAIDDAGTMALAVGGFDAPNRPELAPLYHAFPPDAASEAGADKPPTCG